MLNPVSEVRSRKDIAWKPIFGTSLKVALKIFFRFRVANFSLLMPILSRLFSKMNEKSVSPEYWKFRLYLARFRGLSRFFPVAAKGFIVFSNGLSP